MNDSTLFNPDSQEISEPFDPWALRADLTDRELLAIFVTTLTDPMTAFVEDIERAVDANWYEDEHAHLRAQLHILREALRLAAQRTEGAAE